MWVFIEHIVQSKKILSGRNHNKNILQGQNKHIKSVKASMQMAFDPSWRGGGRCGGRRQTLGEGVGDRFLRAQGDEFDKTSFDQFAHEITANVDVAREFSAHWIFTHSNSCQIVLINFSWVTKILEGFKKIESILTSLAGGDKFGFRCGQSDVISIWRLYLPGVEPGTSNA